MSAIRYISLMDPDGWLKVKAERGGDFSLPYGVKVKVSGVREMAVRYFQVLEGAEKGRKASVVVKGPGQSYLLSSLQIRPAGKVDVRARLPDTLFWRKRSLERLFGRRTSRVYTRGAGKLSARQSHRTPRVRPGRRTAAGPAITGCGFASARPQKAPASCILV